MRKKNRPKNHSGNKSEYAAKISFRKRINTIISFFKSKKVRQIIGVTSLAFSIFLVLSFLSFLFTWQDDQDKILGNWSEIIKSRTQVENNMGLLGAYISHQFILNGFGIASFLIPFYLLLFSLKELFGIQLLNLRKFFVHSVFHILWFSVTLAFFTPSDDWAFLGGAFGYYVNEMMYSLVGKTGMAFFIVVSFLLYLLVTFNLSLDKTGEWLMSKFQKKHQIDTDKYEVEEDMVLSVNEEEKPDASLLNPEPRKEANEEVVLSVQDSEEENLTETLQSEINNDLPEENSSEVELSIENIEQELPVQKPDTEAESKDDIDFSVEEAEDKEKHLSEEEITQKQQEQLEDYDPTKDLSHFKLPTIDLLKDYGQSKTKVSREELEENKNKIVQTLKNYNIEISSIKATIGPTVTLYEIVPAPGIRISKIKNLEDDIALSLAALGIRIIAPIPGRGTIGIEVPNKNPDIVSMREVISSEKFQNAEMELPLALGKTISNETYVVDLAKMPHLLMAGATGQGKSVGLNVILTSLLYKKHPAQVKFVLVDPKKVELTLFNKIERHYLAKLPDSEEAIITDNTKVINTLNSLCIEMDERYELLKNAHVRNIKEYNRKFIKRKLNPKEGHRYLPYIVLVVDEFADLIMTAGKEVETPIARLAQLARAIGIHLIIATQRPSVNVITGTIKANFPARMAFRVTSKIDSKTILDRGGAEQLIGRGDMLLSLGQEPIRIQCAFVDTPEVEEICEYIGNQQGYPSAFNLPEYVGESEGGNADFDMDDRDALFEEAARIIVMHQQGSASLLQRKLKIGYNRAGRIIDQLEAAGIIGPFEGSKARQVLIPDEYALEQFLNNQSENQTNAE
ncbi:MAG: DNA translocase FtsK [Bacteroidetes bacterium]|nr:MAG: DNA translocase FtsK [Bacteroidota bacterium]